MSIPGIIQVIGLENNTNPEVEAASDALRVAYKPVNVIPFRNGSVHSIGRTQTLANSTNYGGSNYAALLMCRSQMSVLRVRRVSVSYGNGNTGLAAAGVATFGLWRGQDIAWNGSTQSQVANDLFTTTPRHRTTHGVLPVDNLWYDTVNSTVLQSFQFYSSPFLVPGSVQLDSNPMSAVTSSVPTTAGAGTKMMSLWDTDQGDQPIELLYGQFVALRFSGINTPASSPGAITYVFNFQNIPVDDFI